MTPEVRAGVRKRLISVVILTFLMAALLFGSAGTLAWTRGWILQGITLLILLVNFLVLIRVNPEVIAARGKGGGGTKTFDRILAVALGLSLLAIPLVCGLDERFGWSDLGTGWLIAGVVLYVLGSIPILWSMAVNKHLEQTVRIQTDRDHQVVQSGPYAIVRHPMYVGVIAQNVGTPLILASVWALAPVGFLLLTLLIRTALEDRTLHAELPGYPEFAKRTRYRLFPGLW